MRHGLCGVRREDRTVGRVGNPKQVRNRHRARVGKAQERNSGRRRHAGGDVAVNLNNGLSAAGSGYARPDAKRGPQSIARA